MDADTEELLTGESQALVVADDFVWDPDGTGIFYRARASAGGLQGPFAIRRVGLGGANEEVHTEPDYIYGLDVRDDGARVSYLAVDPGASMVARLAGVNTDGTGFSEVGADNPHSIYRLADVRFSPDLLDAVWPSGRRIIYASLPAGGTTVLFDGDCGDCTVEDLVYSPSGGQIAFSLVDGNASDVYTMNVGGTGLVNVTSATGIVATEPAWSPEGGRLALVGSDDIYVVDVDGANLESVTQSAATEADPAWSPDGIALAFARGDTDDFEVVLFHVEAQTSEVIATAADASPIGYPDRRRTPVVSWRPCR